MKGVIVTKQHTYKALEILTNLNQQFAEYLLAKPVLPQDTVLSDQVESPPIISILFSCLQGEGRIGQTALSYIYKIGTTCCYHNPQQMIKLFGDKENAIILGKHFYSGSVMEWVIKILQVQESSSFYENEKGELWRWVVNGIENETDEQMKADKIENYESLITTLLQKMDDRYDKGKYINLARLIFAETFPTQFLISNLGVQQSPHMLRVTFQILQKYLHFSTSYRTNISTLNTSTNKSGSNLGVGMFSQNSSSHALDVSINSEISLNQSQIAKIKEFMINATKNDFDVAKFGSRIGTIAFLGLFKSLIISLDQNDTQFIQKIMTEDFVRKLVGLLCLTNSCNILHNHVKDILILSTNKNYSYFVPLLLGNEKIGFVEVVHQIKGKINSNENQYENQLFHVLMNIVKKSEDASNIHIFEECKKKCAGFDEIVTKIKEKQKFYATLIGGNPRKQSSYWEDSSQEQKILTFSFPNQQKNDSKIGDELAQDIIVGKVEHWIQCDDLPLDSDSSRDDLVSSQTFSKQDEDGYQPLSISDEKGIQENGENSLAQKLKNVGVVECEEQQIRVQKRKKKYSGNYKIGANTEVKRKQDKVKENTLENGNKCELKDQQQIELQRQIQILQAKRLKRADGDDEDDSPQIKIKIKNTVDSIDDDDSKGEVLGGRKIEGIQISGLMDFSQEKSKDVMKLDEEEDQGNLGILSNGSLPQQQQTQYIPKQELKADAKEKLDQPIITTQPMQQSNKAKDLEGPSGEEGWNNHFPKYLTFPVEQILSQLDQYL